ncbi:hypothetical protein AOLI_G00195030 [Acnodon oligacanthus]
MLMLCHGSGSKHAELSSELVNLMVEFLPPNLFHEFESRELDASPPQLHHILHSSRDNEAKPATSKRQRFLPFRLSTFRFPKLRLKKWSSCQAVLSKGLLQLVFIFQALVHDMFQAVSSASSPADESSKSLATSASTAVPVGKGRLPFSRVLKALSLSKVFRN